MLNSGRQARYGKWISIGTVLVIALAAVGFLFMSWEDEPDSIAQPAGELPQLPILEESVNVFMPLMRYTSPIASGDLFSVGLRSDGTVMDTSGFTEEAGWDNIKVP